MKYIVVFLGTLFTLIARAQISDSLGFQINELVISADRFEEKLKDLPRKVDVIHKKEIRLLNQQTTADLLQQSGSVFLQKSQQGGGSPVIRGFEANRVLLVIDGIRLNNAIYRGGHLQNIIRIDQEMLEKVEVLFGAGSLIYGSDALGGVVHFVTQKPIIGQKFKANLNTRYSAVNNEVTQSIGMSGSYKKLGYLINYSQSDFQDLKQGANRNSQMGDLGIRSFYQGKTGDSDRIIKNEDPLVQKGTAYRQNSLNGKILFEPKLYRQHTLNVYYTQTGNVPRYDRLSEMNGDTPVFGDWFYGPEKLALLSYQVEDKKFRRLSDQFRFIAAVQNAIESRNTRSFGSKTLTRREENTKMYSINLDLRKKSGIHELRYGMEYVLNQVSSSARKERTDGSYLGPASTRYPNGGSVMWWSGTYVSLTHELSEKWILSEGIRINYTDLSARFTDKSFFSFLPDQTRQQNLSLCGNLGLVFLPTQKIKLYANTGNAYRTPNVDDVNKIFDSKSGQMMVVPNASLKPEQSWSGELGMNAILYRNLILNMNVYYTYLWNAILVKRATVNGSDSLLYDGKLTPVSMPTNAQKGYIYGYQAQIKFHLNKYVQLQSSINYTYGRISADSVMPLDHIPPVYGRTSLQCQINRFNASFFTLYNGTKSLKDYYLDGEDNLQYATKNGMPAWYTLNVQAGYILNKKENFLFNAGIENLLDRNYRNFSSGVSAPGRNIWVNLRINF